MRLETELDKLGIAYTTEIIDNTKVIETKSGIRVHIYKDHITICDHSSFYSFPPRENSLEFVLKVIKDNEPNK